MSISEKQKKDMDLIRGMVLFFALAVLPFIVKVEAVNTRASEYGTVRTAKAIADAFSYYKMSFIMILGVVLALYSLMEIGQYKLRESIKKPVFILPVCFLVLSFLSALFSKYKDVAFNGASERYEGLWVWAFYMLFFATALYYTKTRRRLYLILSGLACGAVFVGAVGALQYFGLNPYQNNAVAKFIMGKYYNNDLPNGGLSMIFTSVFSTLYNPNCVGIYTGMLCPFFLIAGLFAPVRKWFKYGFIAVFVLLLINLFGCESVGGFVGMAAGLSFAGFITLIYYAKNLKKGFVIPVIAVVCLAACGIFVLSGNSSIAQKINIIRNTVSDPDTITSPYFFEDLFIENNAANIVTKTGTIIITPDKRLSFVPTGENVPGDISIQYKTSDENGTVYDCEIPGLEASTFTVLNGGVVIFAGGDGANSETKFYFKTDDGNIRASDMFGSELDLTKEYPCIGFEGMERLGSNRGYIWSRSIPIVLKKLIIGAGPDCFVFEFPQQDILSKLRFLGNPNIIIDKPHNFYLQIAINTGVLSLIALLALFIIYIIQTVKAIFKQNSDNFILGLRLGALSGVIGYLTAVTTTDSVVSVSPVFWILLGIGFALNKPLED